MLAVCFETSLLARELIENTILADDIQNNTEKIALQLSEPLPPTYNGIIAGLNNAVAMRGTANVESPSRASTDLRAAVIGLWCINDTIAALNQTDNAVLQDGELQQTLVDYYNNLLADIVCRFQKTAALNVRSRLHYSSGGVGSIRQRRAAAGHQRTQGGLSATGRSMRHRWPSRRGSESARIDLRCPTSH
uniref:hypothetical protein n=1 Tax=Acinetobacter ursingii TaxID=108980 RepID=UPI003A5D0F7D